MHRACYFAHVSVTYPNAAPKAWPWFPLRPTDTPVRRFAALATVSLSLDGVDGWLARRQGLCSDFGGSFDMEVDSVFALLLVLLWRLADGADALQVLLSANPWFMLAALAAFAFSALAVGLSLPFGAVVALVPLILLTMLIPITISGWGLREAAAAALLPLAGAAVSESLAASVLFGLLGLAAVLPGAAVVWTSSEAEPARAMSS